MFIWAAALTALCVAAGVYYRRVWHYRLFPRRWAVVEEGLLYRSGRLAPELVVETLRKHRIGLVVALYAAIPGDACYEAQVRAVAELGIRRVTCPMPGDACGNIASYAKAIRAIAAARREGKPTLVHCEAGVYRTGAVLACYQMLCRGRPAADVAADMKRNGLPIDRRPALRAFINTNMADLAAMLHERGVIDRVPEPLPQLPE